MNKASTIKKRRSIKTICFGYILLASCKLCNALDAHKGVVDGYSELGYEKTHQSWADGLEMEAPKKSDA